MTPTEEISAGDPVRSTAYGRTGVVVHVDGPCIQVRVDGSGNPLEYEVWQRGEVKKIKEM
jgi:hypothetical protein